MVEIGVSKGHYFPQEVTNEGPTLINAWACYNLQQRSDPLGNPEASSTTAATADGTEVPYESRPTQQAEQEFCRNYSINIIPAQTYNDQHSPPPAGKQQPLQLQQQPLQLQPYSLKY